MKIFIFATFIFQGVYTSQSSKKYILGENNLFLCRLAEPQEENGTPAPLALLSLRLGKNYKPTEIMLAYLAACPVNLPTMQDLIKGLQEAEADSSYAGKVQRLFGLESADSSPSLSKKLFTSKSLKSECRYSSSKDRYNFNFIKISDKAKTHQKEVKKEFEGRYEVNDKMQVTSMYFLTAEKKGSRGEGNSYTRSYCYMIGESKLFPTREHKPFKITLPTYKMFSSKQYTRIETKDFFEEFLEPADKKSECEALSDEEEAKTPKFGQVSESSVDSESGPKVTLRPGYKGTAPLIKTNEPNVVLKRRYKLHGSNHSNIKSTNSKVINTSDKNKPLREKASEEQDSDGINLCRGDISSDGCSLESNDENKLLREKASEDQDSDGINVCRGDISSDGCSLESNDENKLLREKASEDQDSDGINVCRGDISSDGCSLESNDEEGGNDVDSDGREKSGEDGLEFKTKENGEKKTGNDEKYGRKFRQDDDNKERMEEGSIDRGQSDGSRRKIGESSRGKRVLSISGTFLLGGILTSFIATHLLYKKKGST